VKDALEKNNYKTDTINLLEKPEIPASCTVVVVAGPRYEYPQPVVDALSNYVEKGGRGLSCWIRRWTQARTRSRPTTGW